MGFFKGYIETDGKKAVEKFKNREDFKTLRQVSALPNFAGVLASDTVLVDIDDLESSNILLKIVEDFKLCCRVYETTKGKHFLFKNDNLPGNRNKVRLGINILADIKLGTRNSYEVIKLAGKKRKILYDTTGKEEEAQKLPRWFFPIDRFKTDFSTLEAGDGRNQELYNYILVLQRNGFSVEESRETIRIINKYVLKEPLSKEELETILRDESFQKPIFFQDNKFLHDKFAVFLQNNDHILRINNLLHIYQNGIYVPNYLDIENVMIRHIPFLKANQRLEVLKYLEISIRENTKVDSANLIAFENGVYNIDTEEFSHFSPENIITNKIPWKYNPKAYSEAADTVLNRLSCNDKKIRSLLEEAIGYCFYRRNELGVAIILIGDKANGKSTFLSMTQNLLGERNVASLDIHELTDRFKKAELYGKLANIGDDIGEEFIPDASTFRKLVTGDSVTVERKGHDPFAFNPYAKFLFSANVIPRIKDKTGAIKRRLCIIPFKASFTKLLPDGTPNPNFDPYIKYALKSEEVMEYLINLGLAGLKRILQNKEFTFSEKVKKELDAYEETNNPILGFFKECEVEEFQIENEPTNVVYKRYQEYCLANSLQAMSNIEFSRQVSKRLKMTTTAKRINGKLYRVYVSEKQ